MTVLLYILAAVALPFVLLVLFDRLAPAQAARLGLALERRRACLQRDVAQIPGAHMPYLDGGSGETVVLLHGFGGDKDNFTRVAGFLTPSYRVVIPDLPGFGEASRDPQASHTMSVQVQNLLAFLDELGLARVHLGGNSMGGFIAAEFAARYPDRVASLWLLDPAGTAAAFDTDLVRRYAVTGETPLLLRSPRDGAELLRATTARPPFVPYCVLHQLGQRGHADLALHTRIMKDLHNSPYLETRFYRIEAPALIVWGSEDRVLNPKGAEALAVIMPNSQLLILPGIGHLPMIEAPRKSATSYLAFLRALPKGI
jgi:pimeloyl-ACP methyl ester carboxylesterase